MIRRRSTSVTLACAAVLALLSACTPAPPAAVDWTLRATSITSVDSQDEVRVLGACVAIPNCDDEAYLYQIAFRARIGEPGSAQAWVVRGSEIGGLSEGDTRALSGGQSAQVDFTGVQPLDVLEALDPANKFEIVGVYTWAAEADLINSLDGGANSVAGLLRDALNRTIATQQVPDGDAPGLIDLILDQLFNNFGSTFRLILANIPCLGLCDDVLGGRVYLGLGATGALAQTLDPILAGVQIPSIGTGFEVPPSIQGGGIFTMGGPRTFADQSFVGADGHHRYTFQTGPAA
jgi:hypothetical protein